MGLGGLLQKLTGRAEVPEQQVTGALLEAPTLMKDGQYDGGTYVFRLDAKPDLEFRLPRPPLTAERKKGERLVVHYRMRDGFAEVSWVEKT
jgi:hypothetical protein